RYQGAGALLEALDRAKSGLREDEPSGVKRLPGAPEIVDDPLLGRALGHWRLLRNLGEGAFGAVYEAENVALPETHVAVKVLHGELGKDAELKKRFLNEVRAARRVRHENIIEVQDVGITDDG